MAKFGSGPAAPDLRLNSASDPNVQRYLAQLPSLSSRPSLPPIFQHLLAQAQARATANAARVPAIRKAQDSKSREYAQRTNARNAALNANADRRARLALNSASNLTPVRTNPVLPPPVPFGQTPLVGPPSQPDTYIRGNPYMAPSRDLLYYPR